MGLRQLKTASVLLKKKAKQELAHYTLQEHQRIRTNATISKDSDFSVLMVLYEIIIFFYIFQTNLRNQ